MRKIFTIPTVENLYLASDACSFLDLSSGRSFPMCLWVCEWSVRFAAGHKRSFPPTFSLLTHLHLQDSMKSPLFGASDAPDTGTMGPTTTTIDEGQTSSSLLLGKLPAEIRNQIWRLALTTPHDGSTAIDLPQAHRRGALLRTCRQIREEATSIFYCEGTFSALAVLGSSEILLPQLQLLNPKNARQIRHFVVHFSCVDDVARHLAPLFTTHDLLAIVRYERTVFDEAVRLAQDLVLGGVQLKAVHAGAVQVLGSQSLGSALDYDKETFAHDVRIEFENVVRRVGGNVDLLWGSATKK